MSVCRTYDAVLVHAQRHGGNQGANPDQLKHEEEFGPAEGNEHVSEQEARHENRAVNRQDYEHVSRCRPFRPVQRSGRSAGRALWTCHTSAALSV